MQKIGLGYALFWHSNRKRIPDEIRRDIVACESH